MLLLLLLFMVPQLCSTLCDPADCRQQAPLSLLSRGSIFNLEEKKMTALFLGCMKIYGAVGFQAAAPAGHCSDDVRLRRAARAAGPG